MTTLSIAIVTCRPDLGLLARCLDSLRIAVETAEATHRLSTANLVLIDNSTDQKVLNDLNEMVASESIPTWDDVRVQATQRNLGYGRAHNIAITETRADYHLVLNPDVLLEKDAIQNALEFMEQHPATALLTPSVVNEQGQKEFLNKRHPGLLTLLIRGFAPTPIIKRFRNRIAHYELRDLDPDQVALDIPLASGCFMLFRTSVLEKLGGFSEKFFLYFEDYDLSIRTRQQGQIAYVPGVKIIHFGGDAARKGLRHIYYFIRSAVTFFNLHGWKLW